MTELNAPASLRPQVEIASIRRRLVCMAYECLLLAGVLAAGYLVPFMILGMLTGHALAGWVSWVYLFVLLGAYFVWLWRRQGQTLAMQTWRLQLVDAKTGKQPSLAQCWIRYALSWPSLLLTLSGLGIVWAAWVDRDRQFMHDRLAGTCVVFNPNRHPE